MHKEPMIIPANTVKQPHKRGKKFRVAAYCRVSTDHEEQLGSFENQVKYYEDLIRAKNDYVLAGIFADEGVSATGIKHRSGFLNMIHECEKGNVDLIITKSVSRFARNTTDCLNYARKLKNNGIGIIFEKEGINTLEPGGELMLTMLSCLAQEESRNISENTAWGIRSKFKQGIPHLNVTRLLGYEKDAEGCLVINEAQASIVRRIYQLFLEGWRVTEIAGILNHDKIPGISGNVCWHPSTVTRILSNEKYVGDILMQKTYTADFLTHRTEKNSGQLPRYYLRDDHPPIIERPTWNAVQVELARRSDFRKEHDIAELGSNITPEFTGHIFCGKCGCRMVRYHADQKYPHRWQCKNRSAKRHCRLPFISEQDLKNSFVAAWNEIVRTSANHLAYWDSLMGGDSSLLKLRAEQMKMLTSAGCIQTEVAELTRMVLEKMIVFEDHSVEVTFLDKTGVVVHPSDYLDT
ncbi:MAG: recombinase family protein [Lachnospiraceae bacterium]|nr:recombinase family protein [Lachnospiraceae bacterium]